MNQRFEFAGSQLHVSTNTESTGGRAKRLFDIVVALVAVIGLLPLLAIIAIIIWWASPGPVIFRHRRVGFHGQTFYCRKFRTMVPDAESESLRTICDQIMRQKRNGGRPVSSKRIPAYFWLARFSARQASMNCRN